MFCTFIDFTSEKTFDMVILPDVLEHIPLEQHKKLFSIIAAHTHDESLVYINIPSPHFQDYVSIHQKDLQQIIDLSLGTELILPAFTANGFYIHSLKNYPLAVVECDYQEIVLKKQKKLNSIRYFSKYNLIKLELISRLRLLFG